ncbi:hypothetical protein [Cellulomonas soli]
MNGRTSRAGVWRRLAAVGALGLLGVVGLAAVPAPVAVAATDDPAYSATKTLTRTHVAADGSDEVVDSRDVTVNVDHTQNLRGRERVHVSWSGAHPSAARASNPYGVDGLNQEYPVVILQCRGTDDATLPAAQQLTPQTCWTTTYLQRYAAASPAKAVWQHDRYADEADKADPTLDPSWPAACPTTPPASCVSTCCRSCPPGAPATPRAPTRASRPSRRSTPRCPPPTWRPSPTWPATGRSSSRSARPRRTSRWAAPPTCRARSSSSP